MTHVTLSLFEKFVNFHLTTSSQPHLANDRMNGRAFLSRELSGPPLLNWITQPLSCISLSTNC